MLDFLLTTPAQVVIGVMVVAMMTAIGYFVVAKFRERANEDGPTASELLSKFREMHQQGDIDATEYRTIKTTLGAKLQQEEKSKDHQG